MDGEGQAWILANEILKQISRFSIVFAWFFNRISNGFSSMAKAERGFFANAFWMRISRFSTAPAQSLRQILTFKNRKRLKNVVIL